jgi:hypothetical protein
MGACGDDDGGGDDKVVVDSGSPSDGGIDSGAKDAGTDAKVTIDATVVDTGTPTPVDAAVDAAGPVDTGVTFIDAGAPDTGAPDTGAPDTGVADAGTDAGTDSGTDAGTDAGSAPVKPSLAGQVIITEIQAAPNGYVDDNLGEWVEIYNPSASTTYDLGTCTFGDKAGDADFTFLAGTTIAPKAYLTLSASAFTVLTQGFVNDVVYGANSGLSSSSDGPNIVCNAVVIDKVDYSAGASFPLPSAMKGRTLQLSSSKLDAALNDVGSNWCLGSTVFFTAVDATTNQGTPKAANAACP